MKPRCKLQHHGCTWLSLVAFLALCCLLTCAVHASEAYAQAGPGRDAPTSAGLQRASAYSDARRGTALVVARGDHVLFESYAPEAGPDRPHRLASGTKTFWGVLALAAVQDGLLALDERVADTITEWRSDPLKVQMRVSHLLRFTSGLDPAVAELQGNPGASNKFEQVLRIPSRASPGRAFAYGPSHLTAFGLFLKRKLAAAGRSEDPLAYLHERILDPIGLKVAGWVRDRGGNPVMAAGARVAPREWLKLGQLLLRRGRWDERVIIEEGLFAELFRGSNANPAYGLTLWLNRPSPVNGASAGWESAGRRQAAIRNRGSAERRMIAAAAPQDLAMAAGRGKQRLYVIPSLDLVVVRQGNSRGGWDDAEFLGVLLDREERSNLDASQVGEQSRSGAVRSVEHRWPPACDADIRRLCPDSDARPRDAARCFRANRPAFSRACKKALRAWRDSGDAGQR